MTPHTPTHHRTPGIAGTLIRITGLFGVLIIWSTVVAIAYAYGGSAGWIGWLRLPEGIEPFTRLNLEMADVVAYAALFTAILISSTVQLNSTVSSADSLASKVPQDEHEAHELARSLRTYTNQAEMALLASFGSALAVMGLSVLFTLSELALKAADPGAVDERGIGWSIFFENAQGILHPRNLFMFVVSYLLLLATFASMPEWKKTGFFRRQAEENAQESAERLELLQSRMKLQTFPVLHLTRRSTVFGLLGYVIYALLFSVGLQTSVGAFATEAGYGDVFHSGNQVFWFVLFAITATLISAGVGSVAMRLLHLQIHGGILMLGSVILMAIGAFYVFTGEGWWLAISVGIVVAIFLTWWIILYERGRGVLVDADVRPWRFLINPPRYLIARRYENMRHSANLGGDRPISRY
ncbi:hypothetical protein [Corynebacterium sp. A21]|uniref:hypothetical protein n=1 Tax=Corynebacterium sp. A21 TaxID=3457318 RepID=UPI003FD17C33